MDAAGSAALDHRVPGLGDKQEVWPPGEALLWLAGHLIPQNSSDVRGGGMQFCPIGLYLFPLGNAEDHS